MNETKPQKAKRGFATLSAERRREIARQGGRAVQEQGLGHQWTSREATTAGRKGGQAFSLKSLFLKHFTKECTSTITAFFVPLLVAPGQTSHFFMAANTCKKSRVKTPVLPVHGNKDKPEPSQEVASHVKFKYV